MTTMPASTQNQPFHVAAKLNAPPPATPAVAAAAAAGPLPLPLPLAPPMTSVLFFLPVLTLKPQARQTTPPGGMLPPQLGQDCRSGTGGGGGAPGAPPGPFLGSSARSYM